MKIDNNTYKITTSLHDYGTPINFEAGIEQGFSINDQIVFVFGTNKIKDKIFIVDSEDYTFAMAFDKGETDFDTEKIFNYTVKRYKNGQFLETLVDSKLVIENTLEWNEVVLAQNTEENININEEAEEG